MRTLKWNSGMLGTGMRAGVTLGITLCVSCSSGQRDSPEADGTNDHSSATPQRDAKPIPALPIAKYSIGKDDGYALDLARVVVVNECLAKRETDFRLPEPPRPEADGNSRRYGVVDQGIATKYGYHDPRDESATQPSPALNAAQKELLFGSGGAKDGCMAEADTALGSEEPPAQGVEAARTIDVTSFKESQTNADVKKAFAEWSECMSQKGYDYASPLKSAGDKWFAAISASAEEKQVARADVSCKNKVDLVDRWQKAESKIQQGMINRHAKELERLRTFQEDLIKRTRNIVEKA